MALPLHPQGKILQYPLDLGPGESQSRSRSCGQEKILFALLEIELDSSAVQPVARRCTDWAITALSIQWQNDKLGRM
jgi:hypothetical protein